MNVTGQITCAVLVLLLSTVSWATDAQEKTGALLLVANKRERTLSVIDPETGKQLSVVPVGGTTGHEVASSPDGKIAWVPIYGDSVVGSTGSDGNTVSVIDLTTRKQAGSIDLGGPSRPHAAVFNPKDGRLYVTAETTNSVKVIDPASRKVVATIPTGAEESHMLAISNDAKRGYTANVGSGSISVLDLEKKKLITVIPVSKSVQRIAMSRDDRWVFTADQTKPEVAILDTRNNAISRRVPLPALGFGMATTPDGKRLLVALPADDKVSVVNLESFTVENTVNVPGSPQEILVRPDGKVAYISCEDAGQVVTLDLQTLRVLKTIVAGAGADGLAWAP